jgi:predicted DCC family thiol-disulfide oxidoreductase YuxK
VGAAAAVSLVAALVLRAGPRASALPLSAAAWATLPFLLLAAAARLRGGGGRGLLTGASSAPLRTAFGAAVFALVLLESLLRLAGERVVWAPLPREATPILVVRAVSAILAFVPRLRTWAWLLLVVCEAGLGLVAAVAPLGRLCLLLAAAPPPFSRGSPTREPDLVFYDGTCALCHGFVRFLVAEAPAEALRFAPLAGPTARAALPAVGLAPDSIAVRTAEGRLLVAASAILHLLGRAGGIWRLLALPLRIVPGALRDRVYRAVAARRFRFGRAEAASCPVPGAEGRFLP